MRRGTTHITAIGVSPDGKWIATGGWDTRLRIWDTATGRPVATAPAAWMLGTRNLDFSPDGRFVYGPSSGDKGLSKWETATGREVLRFGFSPDSPPRGDVRAFGLSPDGHTLVADSSSVNARDPDLIARWDTRSGRSLSEKPVEASRTPHDQVALSPDCHWVLTTSALYPIEVGPAGNTLPEERFSIFESGTFSADGRLLLKQLMPPPKTENTWRAGVFEVVTGLKVAELPLGSYSNRLAFHPDGRSVVIVSSKALTFHDLAAGKPFAERKTPEAGDGWTAIQLHPGRAVLSGWDKACDWGVRHDRAGLGSADSPESGEVAD